MRHIISCFEVDAAEEPEYWHGFEPRVWSEEEGWHNDPPLYEPEKIELPRCECGGELQPYSWYEPSWMCKSCGKDYNEEALKTQPTQMKLANYRRGDRVRLLAEPDKTGTIDGRNGGYYMVEWDNGTYTALYPTLIEPEGGEQLKLAAPKPLEGQQELEVPSKFLWITYYGPDATDMGVRSFATREEAEAEVERMKANGWEQALTLPKGFTQWNVPVTSARAGEGQMDLGIPNYVDRFIVMKGDWYIGVYLRLEDAKADAEQRIADGEEGITVVRQSYDDQGMPRDECPRCGHMMLKGGVCKACDYNPRFATHPKQRGTTSDNPWGVTEDFSHNGPDTEWNIVKWDPPLVDGWFIEVNAPGKTPAGGWGPFPSYEAAEKYVNENTVLGQKPLFNSRETLPGSMSDIYGE